MLLERSRTMSTLGGTFWASNFMPMQPQKPPVQVSPGEQLGVSSQGEPVMLGAHMPVAALQKAAAPHCVCVLQASAVTQVLLAGSQTPPGQSAALMHDMLPPSPGP